MGSGREGKGGKAYDQVPVLVWAIWLIVSFKSCNLCGPYFPYLQIGEGVAVWTPEPASGFALINFLSSHGHPSSCAFQTNYVVRTGKPFPRKGGRRGWEQLGPRCTSLSSGLACGTPGAGTDLQDPEKV